MGKLFEKMYIGDPNKKDLTKKQVKNQSRLSLYFTVVRVRGINLVWLNLLYSLFLVPTFLVLFWGFSHYALTIGETDPEKMMNIWDIYFYMILLLPCMLIAAPGTLGFTNVLHRWANDEHAWFSDFWTGIKKNWKQGLIVAAINYIALFAMIICAVFYYELATRSMSDLEPIPQCIYLFYLVIGCVIVYLMLHIYIFPLLVRYKLTIKQIYKYAAILAFRNMLGSMVILIVFAFLIYLAMVIPYFMYTIPLLLLAFAYLGVYDYTGKVFNKQVFLDVKDY